MNKEELIQTVSMETGRIVAQNKIAVVLSSQLKSWTAPLFRESWSPKSIILQNR